MKAAVDQSCLSHQYAGAKKSEKKAKEPIRCLCNSVSPDGGSQGRGCGQAAVTPGWRIFEGDTFKVRLVVTDVFSRSAEAAIIPLGAAELHAPFSPSAVTHLEATCATLVFEPRVPTGASAQLTFSHPSCLREKKKRLGSSLGALCQHRAALSIFP